MVDLLEHRLKHLYPDEYPRFVLSRRRWFCAHALSDFETILRNGGRPLSNQEREELAGLAFDTLEISAKKLEALEKAMREAIEETLSENLAESIVPVVIGSVSRFEAESRSDIDPDFIFDSSLISKTDVKRHLNDLVTRANEKLAEIGREEGIDFKLRPIKDMAIYSLQDICDSGNVKHFANLLTGCHICSRKKDVDKKILEAKDIIPKRTVLNELKDRIEEDLSKERLNSVKIGYAVTCYVLRMLALNYLSCEDLDKSYWRLCEKLSGEIPESLLFDIAVLVRALLYSRRRVDRRNEVWEWVQQWIMYNAEHIYRDMLLVKSEEID